VRTRCEAILVTTSGAHEAGQRCLSTAEFVHDGNPVCWLHKRAAESTCRAEPVRFVRQEAEMLRALGCEP
jgi:hypothetical protein